ncbi:MAG: hypothetical protein WD229_01395 [Pirellulales bacterium]
MALAIASLKYSSEAWLALVAGVLTIAFFVALIIAAVDRGPRQAFAIGFALVGASYGYLVINSSMGEQSNSNPEFSNSSGRLPSTRLMGYIYRAVEDGRYYDVMTGLELPNYDPSQNPNRGAGGFAPGATMVGFRDVPPREIFMRIGHSWWALILGYAGGHFARFVYWRRVREEQPLATESS